MSMTRAAIFALSICVAAAPAHAETTTFKTKLDAASEVPPNDSKGVGEITTMFDSATKRLTWQGTYSGLTGPQTMSHYHGPAALGVNAPPTVTVDAKASPFSGSATLSDTQAADLMAGKWYFNIHTEKNRGGEIRGQIVK
jgi:hypothetical protein